MGGSQSKNKTGQNAPKVEQSAVQKTDDLTNFEDDKMVKVADGVHVGTFVIERGLLRGQQQQLSEKDAKVESYIKHQAEQTRISAAEMLENYRKAAIDELSSKDDQIAALNQKIDGITEVYDIYKSASEQQILDLKESYENKLKELGEAMDARGKQLEDEYNKNFVDAQRALPVRDYQPVCQDKIVEIRECYASNRGQTLKCSQIVADLQRCVDEVKKERL